jgi:hypothetical protein
MILKRFHSFIHSGMLEINFILWYLLHFRQFEFYIGGLLDCAESLNRRSSLRLITSHMFSIGEKSGDLKSQSKTLITFSLEILLEKWWQKDKKLQCIKLSRINSKSEQQPYADNIPHDNTWC